MIFISHKKEDSELAKEIGKYLKDKNVESYIDELDPAITRRDPKVLTEHIVSKLKECSHVIVVYTSKTNESMWVPFELGVAYEADKGIGSYLKDKTKSDLPEYLQIYPSMNDRGTLDKFIELYRQTENLLLDSYNMSKQRNIRKSSLGAKGFIDALNRKLGSN